MQSIRSLVLVAALLVPTVLPAAEFPGLGPKGELASVSFEASGSCADRAGMPEAACCLRELLSSSQKHDLF